MSCSHLHRLTKKDYDGTRKTEKDILEMYEFGLEEKALMGTKVKYITFDYKEKKYWIQFGTLRGIYPQVQGNPIRQYVVILGCGGRISGAPGSHLKEVKFLEDIMQTRVQSPIEPTWNQHVNPITSTEGWINYNI